MKIIKILLLCIALVLFIITCTNCKSKKKLVERSAATIERVEKNEVNVLAEILNTQDSAVASSSSTLTTIANETIEGEVADTTAEATITKEDLGNGTTVWKATNFKNLKTVKQSAVQAKEDTSSVVASGQNLSKIKSDTSNETKEAIKVESKKVDIEKSSFLGSWWLWLIIITVIYGVISLWRKTSNPLRWFA